MSTELQKAIREFIVENFLLGGDESELKNSDSFLETGLIDSTGILEVVSFLEETYGFDVADEEMIPENLDSIDNLVAFVEKKSDE